MIIGIDGNEANVEKQVGVSVYTHNLLRYFKHVADSTLRFRIYLRNSPLDHMPQATKYFSYVHVAGTFMWSQVFLPAKLYIGGKNNVFFSPAHYAPRFAPSKQVVTIHDLSYFYYPDEFLKKDLYKLKNWTEYSIKNASHIIAVSKTTKKDIVKLYGTPEEKISVVYNGFEKQPLSSLRLRPSVASSEGGGANDNERRGNPDDVLKSLQIKKEKFILYVGTLQPRKNITVLIKAFADVNKKDPEFKLIITGRRGWMYDEILKIADEQQCREAIIFTGYLDNEQVAALYSNAFCYVMPSLYEGFGIPVLEAMSFGCPVISSFASSLPEVGGDACLYFDPQNPLELMSRIHLLMKDKSVRKELIKNGKERIKLFSWEKCARETLEILKSV